MRDVPRAREDCALTQAAIAMAHALGLRTVAEGVETAEQLAFLQHHGCDEVQGYYFAKPMPAEEIPRFVLARLGQLEPHVHAIREPGSHESATGDWRKASNDV